MRIAILLCLLPSTLAAADAPIRFNRDVRPILADACVHCHGPDKGKRKADLRFDVDPGAKGLACLVPGKPQESELYRRITTQDESERMPPSNAHRALTAVQLETIRRWIEQGAKWEGHWSFTPPVRPPVPAVSNPKAVLRNPIDAFLQKRLETESLSPSPEASKPTLIRRLSLDLTGLPPTPAEVDVFVKDTSPVAVEKLVDRLLASPRYGERQAWAWLEAARYADTNGYQTDAGREMWRWRDWVIEAFNANMPFDRFTIEQIAGDMLPSATLEQKIASGFNRNHRGNAEGGIVPEEFAVEYVVDRVETTATVWLGLTLGCTRCHDHKYDPFTQKEFYRLYAYFNNVPENGKAWKYGNSPPFIPAPTREQRQQLKLLEAQIEVAAKRVEELTPRVIAGQTRWEREWRKQPGKEPEVKERGLVGDWIFEGGNTLAVKDGEAAYAPGRVGRAFDADGKRYVEAGDLANFGFFDKFTISAWIQPRNANGAILSRTAEEPREDGYGVHLVNGKVQVHLTKRWLDDALRVESEESVPLNEWHHVAVVYDGSRVAKGVTIAIDGRPVKTRVLLDMLNQTFATKQPVRIASGGGPGSRFHGMLDDVRIYDRALDSQEIAILATAESVSEILHKPAAKRSAAEAAKLRRAFLETIAPLELRRPHDELRQLREKRQAFVESLPTVMVMKEMREPRPAFVLLRGEYDKPGEKVSPGTPASLTPLPEGMPNNRLGFAKWLVDPRHPLTARVAVNRMWQSHFGVGLVKTSEDFGTQGEFPTHPELLDWLATEFNRTGWDVKRMHKLIVTSAAYRQSSRVTPELLARDPENRLLARGPRYRLSPDVLRDSALFAAGLLVEKPGGPSVKPYQPPGLWSELSGDADYQPDHGEGLYRRSLYTYWKRTSPPPGMAAFDASAREACWVKEGRTNTPLQALTLLNDVTYVEAARGLAQRVMREEKDEAKRISLAFQLVLARTPREPEAKVLTRHYEQQRETLRQVPKLVTERLAIGESKLDDKLDRVNLAAMASVCRLILNLDETVTKE